MTTDVPSPLVPKLRFPEFRVDTTWLAPQLADLYGFKRTNTLSRDNLNYEFGTIRNIHYGDIHTKFKPLFRLENEHVPYVNLDVAPDGLDDDAFCEEGDIVLADASEDLDDVGKAIEVVSLNGERVVAGTHTILATRRGSVPVVGFGGQLFQSTAVRTGIKREAQGAKVYGISANRISAIPVPVPPTEAEQQKVADCLGSLDDLIAAEGRKHEALRQHKQGLMQQLFPQPGKTVPRLRFPEFSDEGEWEEKKISDFSEVKASGDLDAAYFSNFRSTTHLYPIYSNAVENAGLYGYYSVPQYKKNSVTITARGTLGVAFLRNHEFMGIGRLIVVSDLRNLDPCFLKECWNHLAVIPREVTSIPQLTAIAVRATVLPIPGPAEQQRIATCLSSLDNVLTAQARKIDALKQQKQGLLQQLFPSLETK